MDEQAQTEEAVALPDGTDPTAATVLSRRRVMLATAWAIPAITVAVAAPAQASSANAALSLNTLTIPNRGTRQLLISMAGGSPHTGTNTVTRTVAVDTNRLQDGFSSILARSVDLVTYGAGQGAALITAYVHPSDSTHLCDKRNMTGARRLVHHGRRQQHRIPAQPVWIAQTGQPL